MKTCFKCGRLLPLDDFYRHPMMADGHLGKCKRCTRRDVQENYANKRQHYLEYDRKRYREGRHPVSRPKDRALATSRVTAALRSGRLVRGPCEMADDECLGEIQAH